MKTYEFENGVLKVFHATGVHNYCKDYKIDLAKFNTPVEIDPSVTSCQYMFYNCTEFDQTVIIPEGVTCCRNMFANCDKYNKAIVIPSTVLDCNNMFYNCLSLKVSVKLPAAVVYDADAFFMCPGEYNEDTKTYTPIDKQLFTLTQFLGDNELQAKAKEVKLLQPSYWFQIAFPDGVSSRDEVLAKLNTYKAPVKKELKPQKVKATPATPASTSTPIPESTTAAPIGKPYNFDRFTHDPETLVKVIDVHPDWKEWFLSNFPNGAESAKEVLAMLTEDTKPVAIVDPDQKSYSERDSYILIRTNKGVHDYCDDHGIELKDFNTCIQLESGIKDCSGLLQNCVSFNWPFDIPDSVDDCSHMFHGCASFNQPIRLGPSVTNCNFMLFEAEKFDSELAFSEGVEDCDFMCFGCKSLKQYIRLPMTVTSTKKAFDGCPGFYDAQSMIYGYQDRNPYKIDDLEKDTVTLHAVMEKQYNWRPWFMRTFPDGAPSAEEVLKAVKGE